MKKLLSKGSLMSFIVMSMITTSSWAQDAVKGKALYQACLKCHGETGEGNSALKAPKLSGQHDWYLVKQMSELKSGVRKIDDSGRYKSLSESDIKDLAAYITTL